MRPLPLFMLVIGILIATLSSGCEKGEKIVVKYRGRAKMEKTAQVFKDKAAIGFIEEIFPETGLQRVVLRLQRANQVASRDRFVPVRDEAGKMGYRIFSGRDGVPLENGAEIEADPTTERRSQLAASRPERPIPPDRTPETQSRPQGDEPSRDRRADMKRRRDERQQRSFEHLLRAGKEPRNMDADLVRRFTEFGESLEGKSIEDTRGLMQGQGETLQKDLAEYVTAQQQAGNQVAASEARQLLRRLEISSRRINREGDRGGIDEEQEERLRPRGKSTGRDE